MSDGQIIITAKTDLTQAEQDIDRFSKRAQQTLNNLSQVAQDLPFGFIGIQNNLPLLINSFRQLSAEEKGISGAFKKIGDTILSPVGVAFGFSVLIAGITALVQNYGSLGAAMTDIFGLQLKQNDILRTYNKQLEDSQGKLVSEQVTMKNLASILTDTNISLDKRNDAYDTLNKKYPGLLANLDKEKLTTGGLNTILATRIALFSKQIELNGKQEALQKLIADSAKEQFALTGKLATAGYFDALGLQLKGFLQGDFSVLSASTAISNTFKKTGQETQVYSGILKNVQSELVSVDAEVNKLIKSQKNQLDAQKKQGIELSKQEREAAKLAELEQKRINKSNTFDYQSTKIPGLQEQIGEIEKLGKVYTDFNNSYNERKDALLKLKAINADYFGDLSLEKNGLNDAKDALQQYARTLEIALNNGKAWSSYWKLEQEALKNREKGAAERAKADEKQLKLDDAAMRKEIELYDIRNKKDLTKIYNPQIELIGIQQELDVLKVKFDNTFIAIENAFFKPFGDAFSNLIKTGKFAFSDLVKNIGAAITQIVTKIIASKILEMLANILAPGSGFAVSMGLKKVGTGALGDFLNISGGLGGPGAANFAGVGPGGMNMGGQVNVVLRGSDLVGALNRTNLQISRVG